MKTVTAALVFIVFNLYFINTRAQVRLAQEQIKEILVGNAVAGLGGSTSAQIKVVNEAGTWRSYLMLKAGTSMEPGRKSYDSVMHKFIAVVSPVLINNMLNGIGFIK